MTHLVFNEGGEREVIEQVCKEPPDVRIPVLAQTLVIEPIHLRNLPRFMVPAQDGYAIAVTQFEGNEEGDGLNRVVPSVYIVAHKEIIRVRRVAADAEQF